MKGILFKPDMIQAIIEGRKTQTRRVINPQPRLYGGIMGISTGRKSSMLLEIPDAIKMLPSYAPYQVGETVYIKEAWATEKRYDPFKPSELPYYPKIFYVSDGAGEWPSNLSIGRLRSPLHLPEEFARYFLKITGVRAERLQEITDVDCIAEGCPHALVMIPEVPMQEWYHHLWDSINPKYPWEMNPWVWVYSFKLGKV